MSENPMARYVLRPAAAALLLAGVLLPSAPSSGQDARGADKGERRDSTPARYDDYQPMLNRLGIKKVRRGRDGRARDPSDEATANRYKATLPDLMTFKNGSKVKSADQGPKRRAEIVVDFEREVYGRIPKNAPKVKWEVTRTVEGDSGGIATVTRTLVGHIDNSAFPKSEVAIRANFTVPRHAAGRVPIILQFGSGFGSVAGAGRPRGRNRRSTRAGATARSIPGASRGTTTSYAKGSSA